MSEHNIQRYIGVTGASLDIAGDRKSFANRIGAVIFRLLYPSMLADKRKELGILKNSDAEWTLFRLPFVEEGPATGSVRISEKNMPGMKMRTGDIADLIIRQIEDSAYIRKHPFISN